MGVVKASGRKRRRFLQNCRACDNNDDNDNDNDDDDDETSQYTCNERDIFCITHFQRRL